MPPQHFIFHLLAIAPERPAQIQAALPAEQFTVTLLHTLPLKSGLKKSALDVVWLENQPGKVTWVTQLLESLKIDPDLAVIIFNTQEKSTPYSRLTPTHCVYALTLMQQLPVLLAEIQAAKYQL